MQKENEKENQNQDLNENITILPFRKNSMQIMKGNYYYILDPNRYDINSLMMLLDLTKINKLEDKFRLHGEGIKREEFIKLMKLELPTNPNDPMDELNLVYGLYKLFCEIDFNGDGHMQWEEFTQFIIDTVEGENDGKDVDDEEDLLNTGKNISEKQMIKFKRYSVSTTIKDTSMHKTDIIDAVFLPKIDKLFICEYGKGSRCLKIYNPKTGHADMTFNLQEYFKKQLTKRSNDPKKDQKEDKKKKAIELKQSLTFSVLSICASPWNVIAFCLSNNKIMFFSFTSDGKEEFQYEIITPSLQKRVWYLPEHNIWFSAGMKVEGDRYFYLNELDVEFEYKNQKLEVFYNSGVAYRGSYCDLNPHRDEILDVIEIRKPMLVLTACMDGKIRLININDKEFVKMWHNHNSGVRHLDYNPTIETVGYVLSTAFEYYINIYCTDLSIEDAYKGRLEGHYSPVIMCKFLSGSHMCVSVDEEGNVRIWDSKQRLCLQLIPSAKKNFKVCRLLSLPKYNKFIVYGNKLVFYDAKYKETDVKPKNQLKEDNYPIKIDFNKYYMNFYVTTMKDVKIYSSIDGSLIRTFKKLRENVDSEAKIKYFTFEDRYRKFYLGFSNGAVHQFNAGNGSLIKAINEFEIEKDGITIVKNHHTKEVSSIYYYYNYGDNSNFILITTGLDSLINIYNEKNPEISQKLRSIKGGHKIGEKNNDILCMDFSTKLNLFATGSTDGLVTIWDFEMSKIDDVCWIKSDKQKMDVTNLKFLDPYPILVSSYADGSYYFWGVKPNLKLRGECFLKCKNYILTNIKIETCQISSTMFLNEDMDDIPFNVMNRNEFLAHNENIITMYKEKSINKETFRRKISSRSKTNLDEILISQDIEQYFEDEEGFDPELDPQQYDQTANKSYLIFGDSKGYIKILDIRGLIKKFEFEKAPTSVIKSNFNILKKDDINVETILSHHLQKEKMIPQKFTNVYHNIVIREFQAHEDAITCIGKIEQPFSFTTCSKDKRVKIWNYACELLGEIHTQPTLYHLENKSTDWKFKIDWEKLKEKEIEEVIGIFEKVDGDSQGMEQKQILMSETKSEDEKNDSVFMTAPKKVKEEPFVKKRRFKPIEEIKKKEHMYKNAEHEMDGDQRYEDLYVQEIKKKIDSLFVRNSQQAGLHEMSTNLIDSVVNKKDPFRETKFNFIEQGKDPKEMSKSFSKKRKNEKSITVPKTFRDKLFVDKLIKKSEHNNKLKDSLILPLLNQDIKSNEKIKFKKGETERILAHEYYQSSYNSCCEIKGKDLSNESLKKNYKQMWKFIDNYSKHCNKIANGEITKEKTLK